MRLKGPGFKPKIISILSLSFIKFTYYIKEEIRDYIYTYPKDAFENIFNIV